MCLRDVLTNSSNFRCEDFKESDWTLFKLGISFAISQDISICVDNLTWFGRVGRKSQEFTSSQIILVCVEIELPSKEIQLDSESTRDLQWPLLSWSSEEV
ncbi:hypothetical protein RRF57_011273 [Xylaria bambusicola]|uniref:Uncharacterized protein n=1 Tax=Xylaria bambusicola TaxID=326684 RepID=A0AAN7UZ96_9PEZI